MEPNESLERAPSEDELLALVSDADFLKRLRAITKAKATMALHGNGISKLTGIAETGKDADALRAIQLLGQISGDLKAGHSVEVKLSFEQLRQQQGKAAPDPLSDLFEIRGEVIDAEETNDSDDEQN